MTRFTFCLLLLVCPPCFAREWVDASGTFRVEARLIEVVDGKVRLEKPGGPVIEVALTRLSEGDREFVTQWQELQPEIQLLEKRLAATDAEERNQALIELEDYGEFGSALIPRLIILLDDKENSERSARVLREIGSSAVSATDALIKKLRRDNDLASRAALQAIGSAGLPKFIAALDDENEEVRQYSAHIIGSTSPETLKTMLPWLDDAKSTRRGLVVTALLGSKISAAEKLPHYRKALQDQDAKVCESGIQGIRMLKDEGLPALEDLYKAAERPDKDVRFVAMLAINELDTGSERYSQLALNYLKSLKDLYIGGDLFASLGENAVAPLAQMLADDEHTIARHNAAQALMEVNASRKAALPALRRVLDDEDFCRLALGVLATMGADAQPVKARLLALAGHEQVDTRGDAIRVLIQAGLPPDELLPLLVKSAEEDEFSEAIIAIGELGPAAKAALPVLKTLQESDNDYVVKKAREAMLRIDRRYTLAFSANEHAVRCLAISPDGETIYTGGAEDEDKTSLRAWGFVTGKKVKELPVDEYGIDAFSLSADGRTMVISTGEQFLVIDVAEWKIRQTIGAGTTVAMALNPGQTQIVSVGFNAVQVHDVKTGDVVTSFENSHEDGYPVAAVFPDGKRVVSFDEGRRLNIWDVTTKRVVTKLGQCDENGACLGVSPDGKWVVAGFQNGTLVVWDTSTGKQIHSFDGHEESVISLAFDGTSKQLVSSGSDQLAKVWDLATAKLERTLEGHEGSVLAIAVAKNGQIVTGDSEGKVLVWPKAE